MPIDLGKCEECNKYITDGDAVVHDECWKKKVTKLEDEIYALNKKIEELEEKTK